MVARSVSTIFMLLLENDEKGICTIVNEMVESINIGHIIVSIEARFSYILY